MAERHTPKVQTKSKRKAPIFGLNYHLSPDAIEILRRLGQQEPQCSIAKQPSFSKTKVNYWTQKFLTQNLIREKSVGKPKFYDLTALGMTILTRSDSTFVQPCVMEDYPVKFELIRDRSCLDWLKLGQPENWDKLGVHVGNVRVEKTSKSIIIHTGQISASTPDHAMLEAGGIVQIVRAVLLDKGLVLGSFGVPLHEPIYKHYDPSAAVYNGLFGTLETEEEKIDHSPPDDLPHIEHKGRDAAWNFMLMGSRVKALVEKQHDLDGRLGKLEALGIKQVELTERQNSLQERQNALTEKQIEVTERNTEALQDLSKSAPKAPPPIDRSMVV